MARQKQADRIPAKKVVARCESNAETASGVCGNPAQYNVLEKDMIIAVCGDCAGRAIVNGYCVVKRHTDSNGGAERNI